MMFIRAQIIAILTVTVLLTGQAVAMARGQVMSDGAVVLCTGAGPVTVILDENGAPTGAVAICPDYALNLFAAHVTAADLISTDIQYSRLVVREPTHLATSQFEFKASARGPPVLI